MSDLTADTDPLAAKAVKAIEEIRTLLVMSRSPRNVLEFGSPGMMAFYYLLASKLIVVPTRTVERASTNGKVLKVNPEFILSLKPEGRMALVVHEVEHLTRKHHARREGRDLKKWNVAADLAINGHMTDLGFQLPDATIIPGVGPFAGMQKGMHAEWYYARLPDGQQGGGGGGKAGQEEQPGQSQGAGATQLGGGNGDIEDAGDGSQSAQTEAAADWEVNVAQAARMAKQRGALPASIDRLVQEALTPKVDWRDVLREFVSRQARNDYRWVPPSRRFIHQGVYLPGMRSEEMGDLVVAVDTSGSISRELLQRFAGEIQAICEAYNPKTTILYCDARINAVQEYKADEGPLLLQAVGGGGTSHVPVFEWVEKNGGETPCVVCLTDCYTSYPSRIPALPVLWCVYENQNPRPPFGQVVSVE